MEESDPQKQRLAAKYPELNNTESTPHGSKHASLIENNAVQRYT